MLKHIFLYLFIFICLSAFSQDQKSITSELNFKSDVLKIDEKDNKAKPFLYKDEDAIAQALHMAGSSKILYLPEGDYTINKSILLYTSGLHIKGAGIGKTIVRFDTSFEGSNALFQSNGASNITVEGITFTGQAREIKAILEFNSYPNKCKNIKVLNCEFSNLWVKQAINFGGTAANETHSTDLVVIDHCRFYNIYNPSYKIVTNDTDPKCDGINLQQTTFRATIQYCTFQNISGDGIFGWGWSQNGKANPYYGNWTIHHNFFITCWMCVEVNGNGLGNDLFLHHNTMKYSTHNGGFLISVDSYHARIENNILYNVDRCLIEYTAIEGDIKNNTGSITTYLHQPGAVPPSEKFTSIGCIELYGYNNTIDNNHFTLNRTQPDAFTPGEFNCIKLIGKTTDTLTQPLEYKGIKDYSAYWTISYNTIEGFTGKIIDATNARIRNVYLKNNIFRSHYEQGTPIGIYGYNWQIINNVFDFRGSVHSKGKDVITMFYLQKDKSGTLILGNKVLGKDWNDSSTKDSKNNF